MLTPQEAQQQDPQPMQSLLMLMLLLLVVLLLLLLLVSSLAETKERRRAASGLGHGEDEREEAPEVNSGVQIPWVDPPLQGQFVGLSIQRATTYTAAQSGNSRSPDISAVAADVSAAVDSVFAAAAPPDVDFAACASCF